MHDLQKMPYFQFDVLINDLIIQDSQRLQTHRKMSFFFVAITVIVFTLSRVVNGAEVTVNVAGNSEVFDLDAFDDATIASKARHFCLMQRIKNVNSYTDENIVEECIIPVGLQLKSKVSFNQALNLDINLTINGREEVRKFAMGDADEIPDKAKDFCITDLQIPNPHSCINLIINLLNAASIGKVKNDEEELRKHVVKIEEKRKGQARDLERILFGYVAGEKM